LAEQVGRVYLVGAGPGDPGLLTLRGKQCLGDADVILYDYLANPQILDHAPRAEKICLGQHGRSPLWTQDEIHHRMIQLAQEGKTVVRLKGGDPAVFARGAEEVEALARAGIPCELVPGITAALAASSYAGIPITHRDHASAVALITGQERSGSDASMDYAALAAFPGTLVFYMGVTTASQWVHGLLQGGKSPDTPAALVRRCSLPDQATYFTTLQDVPRLLQDEQIRPPVVTIIGDVVRWGETWSHYVRPPLFGRRILVTRPRDQAESLVDAFRLHGAAVWVQSAIDVKPPNSWEAVDQAIERLGQWDWLCFTSSNGVRFFLERLFELGHDARALGQCQLATVGPGTASTLSQYHLNPDLIASLHVAEGMADQLETEVAGKRLLWVRASRGREVLAERLRPIASEFHEVVAYLHEDVETADPDLRTRMEAGEFDWVTVSSSAIARSLWSLFGESLKRCRLVSISPLTSQTLCELGLSVAAEAAEPTMEALVNAVLEAEGNSV
jgi:uroporphyrinogen III methyltransferase / synthase